MIASRGMGDIAPSKMPKAKTITRKDDPNKVEVYKKGGEVWDKPNPAKKHKKLSPEKKAKAKAAAKAAGRPYPNLVDNMRMAKNG
jgi:hypothetical protein